MKKIPSFTNILLISVLVVLLFSAWLPEGAVKTVQATPALHASDSTQSGCDASRSVQVTGSALINIIPDRVMIQLGVESNGVTTDAVQAANSAAIQAVFRAIKTEGIAEKDITTDLYAIEPIYESYDSLYIKGYRIHNMVSITLREIQKTSSVIAAALNAGANQVIDVEFYTSELRHYRDQARELAMKTAQEKAQALATTAGAEVSCVMNISENSQSYYNGWWYGYRNNQNLWAQNTVQNATSNSGASSAGSDEPISLGQISVKAEVSATFSLK
jgi:hypothetical protein